MERADAVGNEREDHVVEARVVAAGERHARAEHLREEMHPRAVSASDGPVIDGVRAEAVELQKAATDRNEAHEVVRVGLGGGVRWSGTGRCGALFRATRLGTHHLEIRVGARRSGGDAA